jgi:hypothetical protein
VTKSRFPPSAEFSAAWDGQPAAFALDPDATKSIHVSLQAGGDSETLTGMLDVRHRRRLLRRGAHGAARG